MTFCGQIISLVLQTATQQWEAGWDGHTTPIPSQAGTECPVFPSTLPKVGLKPVSITSGHHLHSQQRLNSVLSFSPLRKIFSCVYACSLKCRLGMNLHTSMNQTYTQR